MINAKAFEFIKEQGKYASAGVEVSSNVKTHQTDDAKQKRRVINGI